MATNYTIKPFTGGEEAGFGTSQRGTGPITNNFQAGLVNGKLINTPEEYAALNKSSQTSTPATPAAPAPSSTQQNAATPQVGLNSSNQPVILPAQSPQNTSLTSYTPPASGSPTVQQPADLSKKFNAIKSSGAPSGTNLDSGSSARNAVSNMGTSYDSSVPQTQAPPEVHDAVNATMENLLQDVIAQSNYVPESVAQYTQSQSGALGIPGMQKDLLSTQTMMNGTVNDIRQEVQAAGGFATESQIQGIAATRNQALAIHLTNVQNSLSIAQQNLSASVNSFQGDQQMTMNMFNTRVANDQTILSVFKNARTQSVDMYKNLANTIGYQQLANNLKQQDPSGQGLRDASEALGIDLTNPRVVQQTETYREKSLQLSAARFDYSMGNLPGNQSAGIPGAPDISQADVANAPQLSANDDLTKVVPYTGGMNVGAVRDSAAIYLVTGQIKGSSNSKVGRASIANEASAMATRMGLSPLDVVTLQESYKSDLSSMTKLQTQADSSQSFEQTALKNLNVAMSYAKKVPRTNSPWENKYDLWAKGQLSGDPNTVAFESAIYTAANEYAKVVSGGTGGSGSTDTARKEAGDVLNAFYNNEQLDSISNVMKLDMGNRIDSYTQQIQDIKNRTVGQFNPDSGSSATNSSDPAGLGI